MPTNRPRQKLFPTTHWSAVHEAGSSNEHTADEAMGRLLNQYLPALKAYLTHWGRCRLDAVDDLLQGFVTDRIIHGQLIAKADPGRGKFRTLLLTALRNYVSNERRRRQPATSQGDMGEFAESRFSREDPTTFYDIAWARQIIAGTLERMQEECRASCRTDIWSVFVGRVVDPIFNNTPPLSYQQIVDRFGYDTPTQACNILITGKRMFSRTLRAVIAEYAPDEQLIDQEIADLWEILNRTRA